MPLLLNITSVRKMYSGRLDKGDKFACFILDYEPRMNHPK